MKSTRCADSTRIRNCPGETIDGVDILPAREVPLDKPAIKAFRQRFRERFAGESQQSELYRDVSNGIAHGGIEYYLTLFFDATATLLDYLPGDTVISTSPDADDAVEHAFDGSRESL